MRYSADKLAGIDLGRQGENLARTVEIDVSALLSRWPEAVISLLVKRRMRSPTSRTRTWLTEFFTGPLPRRTRRQPETVRWSFAPYAGRCWPNRPPAVRG